MARPGSERYQNEFTHIIYGNNPRVKRVQLVWVQRSGVLSGHNDNGAPILHSIRPGQAAQEEAGIAFGLRDTFIVPLRLSDEASTLQKLAELRQKAAQYTDS
jgi:hypothetical protein